MVSRGGPRAAMFGAVLLALAVAARVTSIASLAEDAEKPRPCSAPEYRQFDFWLGDWDVFDPGGTRVGTNRIEGILDGCALAEHWSGAKSSRGTSLNFYSAGRKRWHQTWIDNQGAPLFLEGEFADGKMTLEGDAPSRRERGSVIRNRITWSMLEGGRVRQLWDVSEDGGKTWKVVFDGTYVRKK